MKLLRTEIYNLNRFEEGKFIFDFVNDKRVYEAEEDNRVVFPVINNVYTHTAISLLGINASGKTSALVLLTQMLDIFIQNESLDYDSDFKDFFKTEVTTVNYVHHEGRLYKIESLIKKDTKRERLYFDQEKFYEKKLPKNISKKNFFTFSSKLEPTMERNELATNSLFGIFLKEEDSIFSSILNQMEQTNLRVIDHLDETNINLLSMHSDDIPISFIHYLDSSIELFEVVGEEKVANQPDKFKLKFIDSEEIIIVDYFNLNKYLSSGTIKGLSILMSIMLILKNGGYLVIDEIENHLNKAIVLSIIKLFQSSLNQLGATLIFSTHYQEIVDGLDRTDSMYILRKNKSISMVRFSKLLESNDRTDKIKSEILLSGVYHTAPQYSRYINLKKDLQAHLINVRGD